MRLDNSTYDIIKTIQRWIPLISTLYVALASIWGLPLADEISKTLMAIAAFLAGILEIATATYNKDLIPLEWDDFVRHDPINTDEVNHEKGDGEG